MRTGFLAIIAVFLLAVPWVGMVEYELDQVQVGGLTTSAAIVMTLAVLFSMVTWSLLSWASKDIRPEGILLSIITGASLAVPFTQVLGPMAAVIVGVVAGFSAFMLQKKMSEPARRRPVAIATVTLAAAYLGLILVVLSAQSPHVWDSGDGIGSWTGTAEGIEESGFENIWNNSIGFGYFAVTVPVLLSSWLVIRGKK